jgi:hypothetical protein
LKQQHREIKPTVISEGSCNIEALLKDGTTIYIIGYDLELKKFDCSDGITRTDKDFDNLDFIK